MKSYYVVGAIIFIKLTLHLLCINQYGISRDEMYFLSCADHLDFGYVDQPPLIAWIGAGLKATVGDSLFAIRMLPIVAGAWTIWLSARLAALFDGGLWAQVIAALATLVAPIFLGSQHMFTMNAFDQLIWVAGSYTLVIAMKQNTLKSWLHFGLLMGIGLLTKLSILFFGASVFFALICGRRVDLFRKPWIWYAAAVSLLVSSPYLFWQMQHGWPTIDFLHIYAKGKTYPVGPVEFLLQQIITIHPLSCILWVSGLYWFMIDKNTRALRPLGWIYAFCFLIFILQRAKFYMLSPLYPLLFAAGGVFLEQCLASRRGSMLRWSYAAILAFGGLVTVPEVLPILSAGQYGRYRDVLNLTGTVRTERHEIRELPQHFADMFGWNDLAELAAHVYDEMTPEERSHTLIFTSNYGEAGAIDYFGRRLGLPRATSGHNSYSVWGSGHEDAPILLSIGVSPDRLKTMYEDVVVAATFRCARCMRYEDGIPITVSRHPRKRWGVIWPELRHFD